MGNKSVEKVKRKANFRSIAVVLVLTVIIASAAVLAAKFAPNAGKTESETTVQTVDRNDQPDSASPNGGNEVSQSGSGFPLSFPSSNIVDIEAVDSSIYVLTNEMLYCISSSGKLKFSEVLNYSQPVIKTSGKYGIVFDRMSGKYLIVSKSRIIYSAKSLDSAQIITAQISGDGSYAIASRSSEAACILTYYDKRGREKFSWACMKDHIVSIDIASNGRKLACAALSASEGEIETKVYLLDIYSDKTEWEHTVKGSAAVNICFVSSGRLGLLCNNANLILDPGKDEPVVLNDKYTSTLLDSYTDKSGYRVTLTAKFGSFSGCELKCFSPGGSVAYVYETESKVSDIFCSGKRAYLLTDSQIICINSFGNESKRVNLEAAGLGITVASGRIYYYSLNTLYKG